MPTTDPTLANHDQHEIWNGDSGRSWVRNADRLDAAGRPFAEAVLQAVDLRPGERVLDLGCGSGATSRAAAQAVVPAGEVLGLDLSFPMLELAEQRAAAQGVANVRFHQADVQVAPLDAGWADAAISRMGVMFFADPVAAFANVRTGVRPGGRLAFACWRALLDNPWVVEPMGAILAHVAPPEAEPPTSGANPGMFAFAEADHVRTVLGEAGWAEVDVQPVDAPISLGADESVDDLVAYLLDDGPARHLVAGLDAEVRRLVEHDLAEVLRTHETPDGVVLQGGAWLVTAVRP